MEDKTILDIVTDTSMDIEERIDELQKREADAPDTEELESQWDVKKHKIYTDTSRFPNPKRTVQNEDGTTTSKTLELTRIGLPYQKKIVNTGVTFYCGIPITYAGEETDAKFEAFKAVLKAVKSEFIDTETRQAYGRWTECAEYWYTQEMETSKDLYGFESKFKVRCNILTPDKYKMYPMFDEYQDLVVFSIMYKQGAKDKFDVFTKDNIYKYVKDADWELESSEVNPMGLIPINFIREPDGNPEYYDVQDAIERLEYIYSATGESNNDFAFPILQLFGKVTGAFTQKQGGRVLEFDNDSKGAQFANQPNGADAIEKERQALERDVHDFTDTPDISLSSMSGLGNILSGVGAEFLFLSAHQKVGRNNSVFEPALKRRISIVSAILSQLNTSFADELEVIATIHPFTINSISDKIKMYLSALGNEQLFSLRYVLQELGIEDPEEMIEEMIKETNDKADQRNADEMF